MSAKEFYPEKVVKYCPVCGASGFSFDGIKKFACLQCSFVRYVNPTCGVMAIIKNKIDEILMVKRAQDPGKGDLDLPGGFVDIGETAEKALIREVEEELNLEVVNLKFFGSFPNEYLYKGIVYFPLDFVFECEVKTFDGIFAKDDVNSYVFVKAKDINLNNFVSKSCPNVINEYIKKQNINS